MNDADRYGLTERQMEVVGLIERRFSRAAIAAYLGVSLQTARDIVGGLCDHYGCPASELPARVREGITASPAAGGNDGATLKSVALVERIHGPMTRTCDVCRGGWWDEDDGVLIGVHHNECPRKDDE